MRDEIERVLEMVKSGALTATQGAELIAALRDTPTAAPEPPKPSASAAASAASSSSEPSRAEPPQSKRDDEDDWRGPFGWHDAGRRRHRGHRERHRHRGGDFGDVFGHLGDDIERAVGVGAKTLKWALRSGLNLGGASWEGESNNSILSRAEPPTGEGYTCTNNHLAVSHVSRLKLMRSTFSGNELNAASIQDIELVDASMTGSRLQGSSIKGALLEHSQLSDTHLNGARLSQLTLGRATMSNCRFNGAQVRDFGVSGSSVEQCRMNGTKLKDCVIREDSRIKDLEISGILGRNWLIENTVLADSKLAGIRVDGLIAKHSGFDGVRFSRSSWIRDGRVHVDTDPFDASSLVLMRDVTFERVILKRCTFEDCRFDGTRFEGFEAADLTFRDVDFSGQTITSLEALKRLAEERDVA